MPKLERDYKTIKVMVERYCKLEHGSKNNELCEVCTDTLAYSEERLAKCKFGEEKPACAKCSVHCYRKDEKLKMIDIMRKTRVWMLLRHPILTFYHFFS